MSQVRAQSQSMVRGEHPFMAFMLPSVSLSEAGSETDSLSVSSEQAEFSFPLIGWILITIFRVLLRQLMP